MFNICVIHSVVPLSYFSDFLSYRVYMICSNPRMSLSYLTFILHLMYPIPTPMHFVFDGDLIYMHAIG